MCVEFDTAMLKKQVERKMVFEGMMKGELADHIGINRATLSRVFTEKPVGYVMVKQICDKLKINYKSLIKEE